jgi:hypothetical protein
MPVCYAQEHSGGVRCAARVPGRGGLQEGYLCLQCQANLRGCAWRGALPGKLALLGSLRNLQWHLGQGWYAHMQMWCVYWQAGYEMAV